MKSTSQAATRRAFAFTLIEMLVVVSIITILSGLVLTGISGASAAKIKSRTNGELKQVQTAIESYKQELGYYPPDNPGKWATNQLYYELSGTYFTNKSGGTPVYVTLDGSAQLATNQFESAFGPNTQVAGFMNCFRGGDGDARSAVNFLKGTLRDGQYVRTITADQTPRVLLGTQVYGPLMIAGQTANTSINPWRYNSSSPTNNPGSFDLWVDVFYKGKTNRFCNWSSQPFVP